MTRTPDWQSDCDRASLHIGDANEVLSQLEPESVNCVVTSPPYYQQRDYDHEDQVELEDTPEEYIEKMVDIFRGVRNTLTEDGVLWLNISDSYAGGMIGRRDKHLGSGNLYDKPSERWKDSKPRSVKVPQGYKKKDLIGIPWMLAFALRNDGWYLRQDIIWEKNAMPESVKDRCTNSYEHIFLLTKSPNYYFDADAIKEKAKYPNDNRGARTDKRRGTECNSMNGATGEFKNRRSVWYIPTQPFHGQHLAVMPQRVAELCILSGCPKGGVVLDPFIGSGTTGIVAIKHDRKCVGVELNPEYAELCRGRLEDAITEKDNTPPALPFETEEQLTLFED